MIGVIETGTQSVNVSAVDLTIVYNGLTSGYLGPTSQSFSGFTASSGSTVSYSITLTSTALLLSHSIDSIYTSTSGFGLSNVSPNLPYTFSPGSSITITFNVQVPNTAYNGVLQITITTS